MKKWWLELYTIPQMKFLAIANVIVMLISILGLKIAPQFFSFYLLLYLFPVFVFCAGGVDGMYSNLDFHKMTVPLKQLRFIFLKDMALQFSAFFGITFICLWIPMLIFYPEENIKMHPMLLILTGTPSYTLFASALFVMFALNSRTARINLRQREELIPFLIVALVVGLGFYFREVFIAMTILLCVLTARFYNFMQMKFHKVRPHDMKMHYSCLSLVVACTIMFSMSCAHMVRYEMNVKGYSVGSKYKTIYVFEDFLPTLEPETVIRLMKYPVAAEAVLKNASKDIYKMPVEMFIRSKDMKLVSLYLQNGKPSPDNIMYLKKQMEYYPDPKDWENHSDAHVAKNLLEMHTPETNSRSIASEKE